MAARSRQQRVAGCRSRGRTGRRTTRLRWWRRLGSEELRGGGRVGAACGSRTTGSTRYRRESRRWEHELDAVLRKGKGPNKQDAACPPRVEAAASSLSQTPWPLPLK